MNIACGNKRVSLVWTYGLASHLQSDMQLSSWSWVLLKQLTGTQHTKNFGDYVTPEFFFIVFATAFP